jgi:transcriptional antiterminator
MYSRFPQLKSSDGVNIVARLKIKYGSKGQLNMIGESLNFWPFISTDPEERIKRKKNLLEDVFEAFFGFINGLGLALLCGCVSRSGLIELGKSLSRDHTLAAQFVQSLSQ